MIMLERAQISPLTFVLCMQPFGRLLLLVAFLQCPMVIWMSAICPEGYLLPECSELCPIGYYGMNCSSDCPGTCLNYTCDVVSGTCARCRPGFMGAVCSKRCTSGSFGQECSKRCPSQCVKVSCNPFTGFCTRCRNGYQGKRCSIPPSATGYINNGSGADSVRDSSDQMLAMSLIMAALLIGLACFFTVCMPQLKKRRAKRKNRLTRHRLQSTNRIQKSPKSSFMNRRYSDNPKVGHDRSKTSSILYRLQRGYNRLSSVPSKSAPMKLRSKGKITDEFKARQPIYTPMKRDNRKQGKMQRSPSTYSRIRSVSSLFSKRRSPKETRVFDSIEDLCRPANLQMARSTGIPFSPSISRSSAMEDLYLVSPKCKQINSIVKQRGSETIWKSLGTTAPHVSLGEESQMLIKKAESLLINKTKAVEIPTSAVTVADKPDVTTLPKEIHDHPTSVHEDRKYGDERKRDSDRIVKEGEDRDGSQYKELRETKALQVLEPELLKTAEIVDPKAQSDPERNEDDYTAGKNAMDINNIDSNVEPFGQVLPCQLTNLIDEACKSPYKPTTEILPMRQPVRSSYKMLAQIKQSPNVIRTLRSVIAYLTRTIPQRQPHSTLLDASPVLGEGSTARSEEILDRCNIVHHTTLEIELKDEAVPNINHSPQVIVVANDLEQPTLIVNRAPEDLLRVNQGSEVDVVANGSTELIIKDREMDALEFGKDQPQQAVVKELQEADLIPNVDGLLQVAIEELQGDVLEVEINRSNYMVVDELVNDASGHDTTQSLSNEMGGLDNNSLERDINYLPRAVIEEFKDNILGFDGNEITTLARDRCKVNSLDYGIELPISVSEDCQDNTIGFDNNRPTTAIISHGYQDGSPIVTEECQGNALEIDINGKIQVMNEKVKDNYSLMNSNISPKVVIEELNFKTSSRKEENINIMDEKPGFNCDERVPYTVYQNAKPIPSCSNVKCHPQEMSKQLTPTLSCGSLHEESKTFGLYDKDYSPEQHNIFTDKMSLPDTMAAPLADNFGNMKQSSGIEELYKSPACEMYELCTDDCKVDCLYEIRPQKRLFHSSPSTQRTSTAPLNDHLQFDSIQNVCTSRLSDPRRRPICGSPNSQIIADMPPKIFQLRETPTESRDNIEAIQNCSGFIAKPSSKHSILKIIDENPRDETIYFGTNYKFQPKSEEVETDKGEYNVETDPQKFLEMSFNSFENATPSDRMDKTSDYFDDVSHLSVNCNQPILQRTGEDSFKVSRVEGWDSVKNRFPQQLQKCSVWELPCNKPPAPKETINIQDVLAPSRIPTINTMSQFVGQADDIKPVIGGGKDEGFGPQPQLMPFGLMDKQPLIRYSEQPASVRAAAQIPLRANRLEGSRKVVEIVKQPQFSSVGFNMALAAFDRGTARVNQVNTETKTLSHTYGSVHVDHQGAMRVVVDSDFHNNRENLVSVPKRRYSPQNNKRPLHEKGVRHSPNPHFNLRSTHDMGDGSRLRYSKNALTPSRQLVEYSEQSDTSNTLDLTATMTSSESHFTQRKTVHNSNFTEPSTKISNTPVNNRGISNSKSQKCTRFYKERQSSGESSITEESIDQQLSRHRAKACTIVKKDGAIVSTKGKERGGNIILKNNIDSRINNTTYNESESTISTTHKISTNADSDVNTKSQSTSTEHDSSDALKTKSTKDSSVTLTQYIVAENTTEKKMSKLQKSSSTIPTDSENIANFNVKSVVSEKTPAYLNQSEILEKVVANGNHSENIETITCPPFDRFTQEKSTNTETFMMTEMTIKYTPTPQCLNVEPISTEIVKTSELVTNCKQTSLASDDLSIKAHKSKSVLTENISCTNPTRREIRTKDNEISMKTDSGESKSLGKTNSISKHKSIRLNLEQGEGLQSNMGTVGLKSDLADEKSQNTMSEITQIQSLASKTTLSRGSGEVIKDTSETSPFQKTLKRSNFKMGLLSRSQQYSYPTPSLLENWIGSVSSTFRVDKDGMDSDSTFCGYPDSIYQNIAVPDRTFKVSNESEPPGDTTDTVMDLTTVTDKVLSDISKESTGTNQGTYTVRTIFEYENRKADSKSTIIGDISNGYSKNLNIADKETIEHTIHSVDGNEEQSGFNLDAKDRDGSGSDDFQDALSFEEGAKIRFEKKAFPKGDTLRKSSVHTGCYGVNGSNATCPRAFSCPEVSNSCDSIYVSIATNSNSDEDVPDKPNDYLNSKRKDKEYNNLLLSRLDKENKTSSNLDRETDDRVIDSWSSLYRPFTTADHREGNNSKCVDTDPIDDIEDSMSGSNMKTNRICGTRGCLQSSVKYDDIKRRKYCRKYIRSWVPHIDEPPRATSLNSSLNRQKLRSRHYTQIDKSENLTSTKYKKRHNGMLVSDTEICGGSTCSSSCHYSGSDEMSSVEHFVHPIRTSRTASVSNKPGTMCKSKSNKYNIPDVRERNIANNSIVLKQSNLECGISSSMCPSSTDQSKSHFKSFSEGCMDFQTKGRAFKCMEECEMAKKTPPNIKGDSRTSQSYQGILPEMRNVNISEKCENIDSMHRGSKDTNMQIDADEIKSYNLPKQS